MEYSLYGYQPAGCYFQYCMAFIVFVGLIYTIIKSNIDDSLIHAKTQDEFLLNLDTVFSRILKHKIKINTDKVFFSDSHIEFVGHEIPHDGVQFSGTKRKVGHRIFLSHRLKTILKKFLGLANYFRDHVKNHSILAQPLHNMLVGYQGS